MTSSAEIAIIIGLIVNAVSVVSLGWKLSRFMTIFELKLNMVWNDYTKRVGMNPEIEGK